MAFYSLDEDEAVILQATDVSTDTSGNVDLILTNKNLIQVHKNFWGIDSGVVKHPLSNLKVLNGKANILIDKGRNGAKQLQLFFINCELCYSFNNMFAESKWANAITKAHKERMAVLRKIERESADKESIFDTLKGKFDSAKGVIAPKMAPSSKTCKCPQCGAELSGNKGDEVKCPYCDYAMVIK